MHRTMQLLEILNPFPDTAFWHVPKFEEAAGDNWNVVIKGFYDTGCMENNVGKGEIGHFEQFHLFHKIFPRILLHRVKWVYMEERVKIHCVKQTTESRCNYPLTCRKYKDCGVLRGSVVKCLTGNGEVLGSSCTGSCVFFLECPWARHFRAPT